MHFCVMQTLLFSDFPFNKIDAVYDMDINEHEGLSNIKLMTQNRVKEHILNCCSIFYTHSRVFNNENDLYPKMNVK